MDMVICLGVDEQSRSLNDATLGISHYDALGQVVDMKAFRADNEPYILEHFNRDVIGRTHAEDFAFMGAGNIVSVESDFAGSDSFRSGLRYRHNLIADADELWFQLTPDATGKIANMAWKAQGAASWSQLAGYKYAGGNVRSRTTRHDLGGGAQPYQFATGYEYDGYGRMSKITQSFATPAADVVFEYDRANNLAGEKYQRPGASGSVGDRFSYDEHHRLLKAWLGANQASYSSGNPDSPGQGVAGYVQRLTYDLDAVNNRESVKSKVGPGGSEVTENYTIQTAAPQGPSNRYQAVGGVTPQHDYRGNLIFDGQHYFLYDAFNRLSEVWEVATAQMAGASAPSSGASSTSAPSGPSSASSGPAVFNVSDLGALRQARQAVLTRVGASPGGLAQFFARAGDQSLASEVREPVSPLVVQQVGGPSGAGSGAGGSGTQAPSSGGSAAPPSAPPQLVLKAVYLYDAFNRRVFRWLVDAPSPLFYAYDGWRECEELEWGVNGSQVAARPRLQSAWGEGLDELVAYRRPEVQAGWVNYFVGEGGAHCASRVLNQGGVVVEQQTYDAYGKTTFVSAQGVTSASVIGNPRGWRGIRIDTESGLLYVRHRFYQPATGRFVSLDPLGVWGDRVCVGSGYNYGCGAPTTQSDTVGLQVDVSVPIQMIVDAWEGFVNLFAGNKAPDVDAAYGQMVAIETAAAISEAIDGGTRRGIGAVQVVASAVEMFGGATMVVGTGGLASVPGAVFIGHGLDGAQAGFWQIVSGKETCTGLSWSLQAVTGASPALADLFDAGIGFGAGTFATRGVKLGRSASGAVDWMASQRLVRSGAASETRAISVYHEVVLDVADWGGSRTTHARRASGELLQRIGADAGFGSSMERLIPGITGRLQRQRNPAGFVWHHSADRAGVMQLLNKLDHESGGKWWALLHPDGYGGWKTWAALSRP